MQVCAVFVDLDLFLGCGLRSLASPGAPMLLASTSPGAEDQGVLAKTRGSLMGYTTPGGNRRTRRMLRATVGGDSTTNVVQWRRTSTRRHRQPADTQWSRS